jgi:V-type H+-transporting ATPase S1 subunit
MQLQAFNVKHKFGPEWDCSNMMPVGLLVGLVVTLFFALICYWGFSMLASIQTMDRFDDPKGKQIYVPQTD